MNGGNCDNASSGPYGPVEFQREFNIGPAALARVNHFVALLQKWQPRINLVSASTLPDLWQRHLRDSAQLLHLLPEQRAPWLDIGSGAGFPGLVLALLQEDTGNAASLHLVESDQRKAIFLQEVIRATGISAQVHAQRIEQLQPAQLGGPARLITARALAPLHRILELTAPIAGPDTIYLLLKGQDVDDELTLAAKYRKMTVIQHPSRTHSAGKVLIITEVARV